MVTFSNTETCGTEERDTQNNFRFWFEKFLIFLAVLELFIQTTKKWTKQQYTRLNQQSIKRVKKWRAKHRNRQKHPKLQSLLLSQHWARRVVQISTRTRNEDERVSRSILKVRIFICKIININKNWNKIWTSGDNLTWVKLARIRNSCGTASQTRTLNQNWLPRF